MYNENSKKKQNKNPVLGSIEVYYKQDILTITQINFGFDRQNFVQAYHTQKDCNFTTENFIADAFQWILKKVLKLSKIFKDKNSNKLFKPNSKN